MCLAYQWNWKCNSEACISLLFSFFFSLCFCLSGFFFFLVWLVESVHLTFIGIGVDGSSESCTHRLSYLCLTTHFTCKRGVCWITRAHTVLFFFSPFSLLCLMWLFVWKMKRSVEQRQSVTSHVTSSYARSLRFWFSSWRWMIGESQNKLSVLSYSLLFSPSFNQ